MDSGASSSSEFLADLCGPSVESLVERIAVLSEEDRARVVSVLADEVTVAAESIRVAPLVTVAAVDAQELPITVLKIDGEKVAVLTIPGNERVRSLKAAIASIIGTSPNQVNLLAGCRKLGDHERLDRIERTASPGGPPELAVTVVISNREDEYCPVDIFFENDVNVGLTNDHDVYAPLLEGALG